ncbi:transporter substrate-binding domain-containing protein [Nocardia tengchongensis]|uniref:transporter substrate-binding domain-containing protein n=1 Tax=Nocardia tengchongensis TaxID=2055889 RepID=UPI003656268C
MVLLAIFALLPLGCGGDSQPTLFTRDRLNVGVKNDQPGTSVWDSYNRSGFDIQLAYRLADAEGVKPIKVRFDDVPSGDRVQSLKDNRVDLVIATFSMTPARMTDIDFAGPYAVTYQGFLVRKGGPPIKTIDDLKGATVCTWTGTTSESEIQRRPDIYNKSMNAAQDCINALQSGQVTAVSTDQLILYGFAHHDPSHTLEVVPDVTIGAPNYYGVGINKAHRPDCKKLADDLQKYVASSSWQADFLLAFPDLADGDKWTNFRPKPEYVSSWSCRDKLPS